MKPGYIVVDTSIHDLDAYEAYKAKVVPIVESYGGEYLIRGGDMIIDQDELWTPTRMVMLKFPSVERAKAFLDSDEYAPVKAVRLGASKATAVIVEGF